MVDHAASGSSGSMTHQRVGMCPQSCGLHTSVSAQQQTHLCGFFEFSALNPKTMFYTLARSHLHNLCKLVPG